MGLGESCGIGSVCPEYLHCHEGKCVKFGTISDGDSSSDRILCRSGWVYDGTCVSLREEPKCKSSSSVQVEVGGLSRKIYVPCVPKGNNEYYPTMTRAGSRLWEKAMEHYNMIYMNSGSSIYDKDYQAFAEFYAAYESSSILRAYEIINENGVIKSGKEYEYRSFKKLMLSPVMKGIGITLDDTRDSSYLSEMGSDYSCECNCRSTFLNVKYGIKLGALVLLALLL